MLAVAMRQKRNAVASCKTNVIHNSIPSHVGWVDICVMATSNDTAGIA